MGALDFLKAFENRAIDAAAYGLLERNFELQEDNSRLLKEKVGLLQEENSRLKAENQSLICELRTLREKVSKAAEACKYVTKDGIAFRRKDEGSFEETPFCPNCHSVLGTTKHRVFDCPKCKYACQVQVLPDVVARDLNSRPQGNA